MAEDRLLNVIASDKPIVIRGIKIDCYVLEGKIRVLSQRGLHRSLGLGEGGGLNGAPKIIDFVGSIEAKLNENSNLTARLKTPIKFRLPHGGRAAYGYRAELLPELCNKIIDAAEHGALGNRQAKIIEQAVRLVQGLANVGITAMVDASTGFEIYRHQSALQEILETYLLEEARPWVKTFPLEFYKELFRLRKWEWEDSPEGKKPKTPSVVGKYTNNLIYKRLLPAFPNELVEELDMLNPKIEGGTRQKRHHQWFEAQKGLPLLQQHIYAIIILMRSSQSWGHFERSVKKAFPVPGDQDEINLDD